MTTSVNSRYSAIVSVSPMCDGTEEKDQDRAVWCSTALSGCVCDGATSSPFSAQAAEFVTQYSPVLFSENPDDVEKSLRVVCNLLMTLRNERRNSKITIAPGAPQQMEQMLQEVARENMKNSFQTTMVAAKLVPQDSAVITYVIRCGDSIFLAFSSDGELLAASPSNDKELIIDKQQVHKDSYSDQSLSDISFGPSDELLAKVLCRLPARPALAAKSGVKPAYPNNWLVCMVLDRCSTHAGSAGRARQQVMQLRYRELLLVPKYMIRTTIQGCYSAHVRFCYSPVIRHSKSPAAVVSAANFQAAGSVTAVLPDHFYAGNWVHFQDRFPLDASYLLASDGMYRCFKDPQSLWMWLKDHRQDLQDSAKQNAAMEELHRHLRAGSGDDDISYVWIYPQ